MGDKVELVCPAGSFPALRAAVDNGADAVYMGFRDATNARNFPGLNFDERTARQGMDYAHQRGAKVLLALNTYPQPQSWSIWTAAVDKAAALGVDALILADPGLMGPMEVMPTAIANRGHSPPHCNPRSPAHDYPVSLHTKDMFNSGMNF